MKAQNSLLIDKFAASTSILCAIHCLFLPFMLSVFPAVGTTIFGQESFHALLLFLVVPLSVIALTLGCKQHKNIFVPLMGLAGLTTLIFTALFGHDTFGHDGERIATLVGASVIASSHLFNYKLCRQTRCCEH